jgi:hypothetical protein
MHGVWEWNASQNAGTVLRETYFMNDPVTGRKVRLFFGFKGKGSVHGNTVRLVHGFLLPIFEALDRACTWSRDKWTRP